MCALIMVGVVGPAAATPEEDRLKQSKDKLSDVRSELEQAREDFEDEQHALEVAEERVAEVLDAVGEAEMAVERQQAAVDTAKGELEEVELEAREHQELTSARIAELYRTGGGGASMTSVLASDTPGDAIARSGYLDVINRADRESFEGVLAAQRAIEAQASRLAEEEKALERVLVQQEELLAEVEELREDQAIAAAEAKEEVEDLESHEVYLESESRELAAAARTASNERREARASRASSASGGAATSGNNSAGGGSWRWPANGTVTSEYGSRWGRLHAGIDIAGGHGSAITAARGGTVSSTGRMGGYGNLVLVDHGGGIVTAYAHLSSIEVGVGQSVSAGQRIGGMGCTGSCTGTHLHFEVRVNGNAQNPRGYLP